MIEELPAEFAMRRGVKPFESAMFGSAPSASRVMTALVWPWRAASISAVRPSESRALMFTLASIAACNPGTSPDSAACHSWSGEAVLADAVADFAAAGVAAAV